MSHVFCIVVLNFQVFQYVHLDYQIHMIGQNLLRFHFHYQIKSGIDLMVIFELLYFDRILKTFFTNTDCSKVRAHALK